MSNTQKRIKQRRQYIRKKGAAYTKLGMASLLTVPLAVVSVLMLLAAVYVFVLSFSTQDELTSVGLMVSFTLAFLSMCFGVTAFYFGYAARQARQEARQLPYVPPVNTDRLPNEEVLLRGSQQPAQEPGKFLLRSADGSAGTAQQELLRSSQDQE